jgi:hypothetical protein
MTIRRLFTDPNVVQSITRSVDRMREHNEPVALRQLAEFLLFIITHGEAFDNNCQISIGRVGKKLIETIENFRPPYANSDIDFVSTFLYRFAMEYDISIADELPMEVGHFMAMVEDGEHTLSSTSKSQYEFARKSLPIAILKSIINTNEFSTIRNIEFFSNSINDKINGWEVKLDEHKVIATNLGEIFLKHANDFNFSGLHEGFSDMAKNIKRELRFAQFGIFIFGLLLLTPATLEIYFASTLKSLETISPYLIGISAAATLTLTLLFLYFFRIALRKADSCRAQLLQISLRMSLCRFIQPYTDYSKNVRDKHADTFAKFENLIFSGIVGTTEQLPSTFEGLEQIAALGKSLRGDK